MGAKTYSGGYRMTLRAEGFCEILMSICNDVYIDFVYIPCLSKLKSLSPLIIYAQVTNLYTISRTNRS